MNLTAGVGALKPSQSNTSDTDIVQRHQSGIHNRLNQSVGRVRDRRAGGRLAWSKERMNDRKYTRKECRNYNGFMICLGSGGPRFEPRVEEDNMVSCNREKS